MATYCCTTPHIVVAVEALCQHRSARILRFHPVCVSAPQLLSYRRANKTSGRHRPSHCLRQSFARLGLCRWQGEFEEKGWPRRDFRWETSACVLCVTEDMWRGSRARAGCSTSANPRPATSRAVDGAAGSHLEPTDWQHKAGPPQADKAAPVDLLLRPPECVPPRSEPEPETFVVAPQGEPILPTMWFGVRDFLPVCNCDRSAVCRRWHRSENQWHRWPVVPQVFTSWSHLLSMKL